jgi:hypothetical protein
MAAMEPLEPRALLAYHALGTEAALYMIVRFADQAKYPQTIDSAQANFDDAGAFWQSASFGQFELHPTIVQVTLHKKAAQYRSPWAVLDAARAAAKDLGYDDADFAFDAARYSGGPGNFGGLANVADKGALIKSNKWGVLVHEFGHNLGLDHARAWKPIAASNPVGRGKSREYGDPFDVMADAYTDPDSRQYNAFEKNELGWLANSTIEPISTDGTYTIYAHDLGSVDVGETHALTFDGVDGRHYWLDLRENPGQSDDVRNAVFLHFAHDGATWLVDTHPATATFSDAMISIDTTFSSTAAGVSIHPVSRQTDDAGGVSVTLQIDFAPFTATADAAAAATSRPSRRPRSRT